ncbi:MAG: winged helix-turn-helix transcriptional regulator [Oligoflexia bacterium]|nr:winged helix-turn-helix transcriptional regulator [Oligoflexia bacterium]
MDHLVSTLKAIGDKNRLRIVGLLANKKLCVCELAYILKITQPSVSKHLKKLKEAGIIESEQDGFWTNYFLVLNTNSKKEDKNLLSVVVNNLSQMPQMKVDMQASKKADREKLKCKI